MRCIRRNVRGATRGGAIWAKDWGAARIKSKRKSTVPVMTQKWHADAPRGHHHVRGLESQTPFRHGRRRLRAPR